VKTGLLALAQYFGSTSCPASTVATRPRLRLRRLALEPLEDRRLLSLDIWGAASPHDDLGFIADEGLSGNHSLASSHDLPNAGEAGVRVAGESVVFLSGSNDMPPLPKAVVAAPAPQSLLGADLYADAVLTTPGLVGSYVDRELSDVTAFDDWRISQTIAGTRVDSPVEFLSNGWGSRDSVGLTGGSDADWEGFSVQWDGFLNVTEAGQRFATVSDDGSRMWIDLDQDDVFEEEELLDNGWGGGQGATTGERTAGVDAGVYPIRIQYYEIAGGNVFSLESPSYVPQQFIPTPTNPQQTVTVVVLNFDPHVPSEQNQLMHEVFNWSDPRVLATQFERDLEWATGGAIDVEIVDWRDLDAFPTFTDGFRYNPDEYVQLRRDGAGWHDTDTDFYELVDSQGLLPSVNSGAIDEIWLFGDHYFGLLGEAWMAGPNSFFINGPTFSDVGFDRAVAGYGFNYERGVAEMVHNLCHRTENHGQRAFGSWNLANPVTAFDLFSANYLDTTSGPYGVGTCHVPANADGHYDYADPRVVDSTAADFVNYPNLTGATQSVDPDTWALGPNPDHHRDYLNWYFAMMPGNDGAAADGRMANWYKYIWDFNSYEANTGLARGEDAFGSGPIVGRAGDTTYDLTVRYYDQTGIDPATIDGDDVLVTGPGGVTLPAAPLGTGVETDTTAGTARTVTYRITPPGGSWDVLDNGAYAIEVQADAVRDTEGNAVPSGQVGTFRVAAPDPALINVAGMLAEGSASVAHTTFDVGLVENLFDGDTSTLVRTPAINPAEVTLTFALPQTLTGLRAYFSHAWGDPAYQYTVEAADTLADLTSETGSYVELVPATSTSSDVYSTVTLTTPHTAALFRLTATRLTGDAYVHINEWQLLGTATGESDPPMATLLPVSTPERGQTAQFIDVTFTDATAVDVPSIATGDLLITGPEAASITPVFYDVVNHVDGPSRTATYWFIPSGGSWDYLDNGTYTIELQAGAVSDVLLNASTAPQTLGTFEVDIDPPQFRPADDLAEQNAADWTAWADGATASTSDDVTRTVAGTASVRFDTTGGLDTSLSYPDPGEADWDLAAATELTFSVYAENPSPSQFQEGPWVRLNGVYGCYYEYRYYENDNPATPLNSAIGQWVEFTVPLDPIVTPTGWRRTTSGTPDLGHIGSVEFHADTWDAGFTLWYDGVGFDVPADVVGRHIFYDNSHWDGDAPGPSGTADDPAIAPAPSEIPDETGTHDGGDNVAVLTDSTKKWGTNFLVGLTVQNVTDGSSGTITANTQTTITATLAGGDNDWDDGDTYSFPIGFCLGKTALLPGGTATPANYTSFSGGITGIMIDIQGLPNPGAIDASHFLCDYGNDNTPDAWADADAPSGVAVRPHPTLPGVSRVTITWNRLDTDPPPTSNISIPDRNWLRVEVVANADTGLSAPDVFYFGNNPGENTRDFLVNYDDVFNVLWPKLFTNSLVEGAVDTNRDRLNNYDDLFNANCVWPNLFASPPLAKLNAPAASAPPPSGTPADPYLGFPPPAEIDPYVGVDDPAPEGEYEYQFEYHDPYEPALDEPDPWESTDSELLLADAVWACEMEDERSDSEGDDPIDEAAAADVFAMYYGV